jgi:PAS domain S-box-containing protein
VAMGTSARGTLGTREFFYGNSQVAALMRERNWAETSLGPVDEWPRSLRAALGVILGSGYPMYLAWGSDFIQFYNDAYLPILGIKHPSALGIASPLTFPEIWEFIGPMFRKVIEEAETTSATDQILFLERGGYPEECYFTFSYSPVPDDEAGKTGGVFVTALETTDRIIGERRLRTLGNLAAMCSQAKSEDEVFKVACEALASEPHELPFALLYRLDGTSSEATIAGRAGMEAGHRASPDAMYRNGTTVWPFVEAIERNEPFLIEDLSIRFHSLPSGAWTVSPSQAMILPIVPPGQTSASAFLVAALNPHKRLDDNYQSFLMRVVAQIGSSIVDARAFEEERGRAEALAEIDRAKTAFFTNISHEFRTPITLMLAPLEDAMARAEILHGIHSEDHERLKMIHRNGLRLLKLVNALLDFSRIEAGRVTAKFEPTALDRFTTDLASTFRSASERTGLDLTVSCKPIGEPVYLDREMWEKIVLNLLSNAFKFTLAGSITIQLQREGTMAKLEVSDTGVGISEDDLPRIFERFHRAEGPRGRSIEGTGIGLALVQELVKLHGGRIEVKSELGEGTIFTVSMPIAGPPNFEKRPSAWRGDSPSLLAEGYVEEALHWLPGEADLSSADLPPIEATDTGSLRSRIVVADDNADMREYLSRVLGKEFTVNTFPNGAAALAALSAHPPDLVLTDAMMPDMDGFELLKTIRERPHTKHIPVIMVSARAGQEARIEGLQSGADDYVTKPFSARELLARVRAQLSLSRLRNESSQLEHALRAEAEAERNKLHDLFQVAPASIVVMRGPEHRIVLANELYVRLVGRDSVDELMGKSIREALPEVQGQGYFELLDEVYRSGVAFSGKEAPVTLGSDRQSLAQQFCNFSYQPTFDSDRRVDGILAHIIDVTEQVIARRKAEESESRFRLIADAAPALIWMAAPDMHCNYFNRGWLDFVGRTRGEEIGNGWIDNVFPDDYARYCEVYRASSVQRVPFEVELRLRHNSGEHRWILNRAVPRFGPDGEFDGYIGVCIDINGQKLAEETLRKSEKLAVAGRLAATISHEINNPLQAVTSLHHLMSRSPMSDELRSYLTTAEDELARVTHIVTHALKFHRQATSARNEKLSELLDSTIAVYQGRLRNSGVHLIRKYTEQQPVHCMGSEIRQVFANLIGNAIDATRPGGKIILKTRDGRSLGSGEKGVQVIVADTGHGMDAHALTRLFEPFFTTKGIAGTGLGLWVSKGILDNHGATMRVKSRQAASGSGTAFSIFFPVRTHRDRVF